MASIILSKSITNKQINIINIKILFRVLIFILSTAFHLNLITKPKPTWKVKWRRHISLPFVYYIYLFFICNTFDKCCQMLSFFDKKITSFKWFLTYKSYFSITISYFRTISYWICIYTCITYCFCVFIIWSSTIITCHMFIC